MSPHVLLNALFLDPGASGGVETYLHGLAPALVASRPEARVTVATTRRGARALRELEWPEHGISVAQFPCDEGNRVTRQWCEQVLLPIHAARRDADIVHSLASVAPIAVPTAAHVITVHDVTFMHHMTFNAVTTWGMSQVVPRAARRAQGLIAVSAAARDDICATLGLAAEDFTVVHSGAVPLRPVAPSPTPELRRRLGLDEAPFVLCVAAKRPHKNQEVLIRALAHLPDDLRLVLAGHAEPYEHQLRSLTCELGLTGRVIFPGWVSDADLEAMWSAAAVVCLPTLAEGFGLPLIEALAHGSAVAASDLPVLREVGGPWPHWFDPHDPVDVARALTEARAEPPDADGERAWAAGFSWSATAEQTWDVYDRVLAAR